MLKSEAILFLMGIVVGVLIGFFATMGFMNLTEKHDILIYKVGEATIECTYEDRRWRCWSRNGQSVAVEVVEGG